MNFCLTRMRYATWLIVLILIFPGISVSFAQYSYRINGKLQGGAGKTIYLSDDVYVPNTTKHRIDSVVINEQDEFQLTGKITYAGLYSVFFEDQKGFCPVMLDTKNPATILGHAALIYQSKVSSPQQHLLEQLAGLDRPIQDSLESTLRLANAENRKKPVDSVMLSRHVLKLKHLNTRRAALIDTFAANHPGAYSLLPLSENHLGTLISFEKAEGYLRSMPAEYANNPLYLKVNKLIAGHKATQAGLVISDFELRDANAKLVNTAGIRKTNKYMIIDFWASWCTPCRANNQALLKLYRTYHPRQLEIVGISIDDNLNNWKTALKQEDLPWPQLIDTGGFSSASALRADIRSIPSYLLTDAGGRLILKTHKVEALTDVLKVLLP
ncbi:TlpA disulfide reductase family protein [Pedobacter sp. SYP-B3415]|uniref:TlpA disulfide reductase family protein n=1 Tax=Pedobacter sp. SYP-B3415 TaxID=2496641 RepID=UPI00101C25B1|nr:TlpA disulfide reductase family protein [Pedobacter sp. SYP-B3415]